MSRTSIIAILASAGVVFTGQVTSDAVAFAKAVQSGDELLLNRFAQQNPDSRFAQDAIRLAESCVVNWAGGSCGNTNPVNAGGGSDFQRGLGRTFETGNGGQSVESGYGGQS